MSQTDLVRQFAQAWNDHDLDAMLELVHEEVEFVNAPMALEPGTRRGKEALADVTRKQRDIIDSMEIERLEPREDGVLGVFLATGTIPGSDAQVEARGLIRWTVVDGLIRRIEVLGAGSSFQEALGAAGLEGSS
jgi:ketosteroid isomerase-like protein